MLFPDLPLELSPRLISMARVESLMARVLDRTTVDPFSGCWRCDLAPSGPGACRGKGYPQLWDGRSLLRANRVSFEYFKGPVPEDRPFILHRCDVTACVNPGHLWAGTHADNLRDMALKNRGGQARLSVEAVRGIVLAPREVTARELAERFGIVAHAVRLIRRGERRGHLRELFLSEVSNGS